VEASHFVENWMEQDYLERRRFIHADELSAGHQRGNKLQYWTTDGREMAIVVELPVEDNLNEEDGGVWEFYGVGRLFVLLPG
jgi:hypothetical protein